MKCYIKPILRECFQWTGGIDQTEDPEWIIEAIETGTVWFVEKDNLTQMVILTDTGQKLAKPGDYIMLSDITGIYPISKKKFEELFVVVKE